MGFGSQEECQGGIGTSNKGAKGGANEIGERNEITYSV